MIAQQDGCCSLALVVGQPMTHDRHMGENGAREHNRQREEENLQVIARFTRELREVEQRLADAGAVKDGDGKWRWRNEDGSYSYLTVDVFTIESALRKHTYPTLGGKPLGSIKPSQIQAWRDG